MCEQVATREVTEDNGEWGGAFGGGREGGGSRLEEGPAWRRVNSIQSPEDAGVGTAPQPHPLSGNRLFPKEWMRSLASSKLHHKSLNCEH